MPTLDLQVNASLDDVFHRNVSDAFFPVTSSFLAGRISTNTFDSAALFRNVTIPKESTIIIAHMLFTPRSNQLTLTCNTIFRAEATGDASIIADDAAWHSMVFGSSSVPWLDIPPWLVVEGEKQTPSLVPIFQELVDRPDWNEGSVNIFWLENSSSLTGAPTRIAESFDANPLLAPKLHIEWIDPPPITDSEIMEFNLRMAQNPTYKQGIEQNPEFNKKIEQNPSFTKGIGRNKAFDLEA